MKQILFLISISFLILSASSLQSQTTAMDFDQADCSGTEHHLYDELDAGKVVVMDYIMLNCAPCIVATHALEDIVASYQASHPGRVILYSYGFLNSYTCDQLTPWIENNNFSHPIFNNGEEQVNYYGGMGMPTIIVLGSNEHKVYYNGIGYTPAQDELIRAAVNSALQYDPTSIGEVLSRDDFSVYPTTFSDHITVKTNRNDENMEMVIMDITGKIIFKTLINPEGVTTISVDNVLPGLYIALIKTGNSTTVGYKLINK